MTLTDADIERDKRDAVRTHTHTRTGTQAMTAPTLTDAEVERIARRYCEAMGLDPDRKPQAAIDELYVLLTTWRVRDRLAWKIALAGYGEKPNA